jgi:hypothetical protein
MAAAVVELYRTRSLCPLCTLTPPHRGVGREEWTPARVEARYGTASQKDEDVRPSEAGGGEDAGVYLVCECPRHGDTAGVCVSSDVEWFMRMRQFTFGGARTPEHDGSPRSDGDSSASSPDVRRDPGDSSHVPDVEDLASRMQYAPTSKNLPLVVELALFEEGKFVDDADIVHKIHYYRSIYPARRHFVLKLTARGATDIASLNEKIVFASGHVPRETVLVIETTYERLCLLCRIRDDSGCFVRPNIFPGLKYFLKEGDEEQCIAELTRLFRELKAFSGLSMAVTLCVSPPFPRLERLLKFIRQEYGFIRLVTISFERSPAALVESIQRSGQGGGGSETGAAGAGADPFSAVAAAARDPFAAVAAAARGSSETLPYHENADIFTLLRHIQAESGGSLSTDDFFPAALGEALEPFLRLIGYGWFYIRPSPMCAFGTVLVNTEKTFDSTPLSRILDVNRLQAQLRPILPRLADGKVGLMNAKRLQRAFQSSILPPRRGDVPKDLGSYVYDPKKAPITREFIQNLQFFIVHNNMDVAALDFERRCECASASATGDGLVAYCTGCI